MKKTIDRLALINEYELAPDATLFSQQTLAAVLNCSLATLERDRWAGNGVPFVKLGRLVRYRKSDIQKWIANHELFQSTSEVTTRKRVSL